MPPASPDAESDADSADGERRISTPRPREMVRRSLITGAAIILPLAVTLLVLDFVLSSIAQGLNPVTNAIQGSTFVAPNTQDLLIEGVTVLALVVMVLVIGFVVEFSRRGEQLGDLFDDFMAAVPGIGSVYSSFNEMSEIMLDSDTDSFQEVKLVEYPGKGAYTVAFKTADTPGVIETDTGHDDMVTLFMPMAPNPVMGGFVIHVSTDRVVDVDLTVEQGIRSIVTSGVAVGGNESPDFQGLSESEMRELGHIEQIDQQTAPERDSPDVRHDDDGFGGRTEEYEAAVSPEHSDTPGKIADRERDGDRETTETVPAEEAGRDSENRGATDETPAEASGRDEASREPTEGTPAGVSSRDGE